MSRPSRASSSSTMRARLLYVTRNSHRYKSLFIAIVCVCVLLVCGRVRVHCCNNVWPHANRDRVQDDIITNGWLHENRSMWIVFFSFSRKIPIKLRWLCCHFHSLKDVVVDWYSLKIVFFRRCIPSIHLCSFGVSVVHYHHLLALTLALSVSPCYTLHPKHCSNYQFSISWRLPGKIDLVSFGTKCALYGQGINLLLYTER